MTLPLRVVAAVTDVAAVLRDWKTLLEQALAFPALDRPQFVAFSASGAGEVDVLHKMGRTPRGALPLVLSTGARVWQRQEPDSENLYLQTSGAVSGRLWVW